VWLDSHSAVIDGQSDGSTFEEDAKLGAEDLKLGAAARHLGTLFQNIDARFCFFSKVMSAVSSIVLPNARVFR